MEYVLLICADDQVLPAKPALFEVAAQDEFGA
jgi:hypothetical protein